MRGLAFRAGILSVFFLISNLAFAQSGKISGVVINDSDDEPLIKVDVVVKGIEPERKPIGALTDEKGCFEVPGLMPGSYTVSFSSISFQPHMVKIILYGSQSEMMIARLIPEKVISNTVLVSASRRPEKILDAPASVSVVGAKEIENNVALTPGDHIKGRPSVDNVTTGLSQSNIVIRGFNNVFSGALLVLTDNRIARVPSLRYNAYSFIPVTDDDIERIELVSGPGSALYGPNSASGIMHIITKSPFSSEGTTVNMGGGERDLVMGSFRHAGSSHNRFGYKISGRYFRGNEWESTDHYEPDSIRLFKPTVGGPRYAGPWRENNRDFQLEKASLDMRADIVINDDGYLIVNGGLNRAKGIELTSLGAAQADGWTYIYAQTRFMYKDLFLQGFVNASDAGDTYLLRTGQMIIDKSKVYSSQVQHKYSPMDRLSFIYGLDAIFTRPETESTINGRNEADDNINEYGIYLQTEAKLSDRIKLIGAGRIDRHNRLEGIIFSPRAAAVFQPRQYQNFRLTYNRAYSTPNNTNLFLDILQADDPFGVGSGFEPIVGYSPDIDIRVQGVSESGFHWSFNNNGPRFRSSFAPLDPRGLSSDDYIDFNDPVFTNVMWDAGSEAVISGFESIMTGFGVPRETVDSLTESMRALTPTEISGVNNVLGIYNPDNRSFDPVDPADISDIDPLRPTYTKTLELGYKGMITDRIQFSVDLYRTEKNDFVGPLAIETPNVFLDGETLSDYLFDRFAELLADPANADHAAVLAGLDDPSLGGNGNGTAVDELTNMFVGGTTRIPFGTVSPDEAYDPTAVLVTFRNFGDITLYGADIALMFRANSQFSFGGGYSFISRNLFEKSAGQLHDIYLNAPKHKFALYSRYSNRSAGFDITSRLRFVDSFDMYGPFMGTKVESYVVVDLNASKEFIYSSRLSLTVKNFLDNKHTEFVGAPEIGRLAILRVSRSF
ncbi:MAG: TonB-dependent receptor [candidate division Zixibacteria bacterium]